MAKRMRRRNYYNLKEIIAIEKHEILRNKKLIQFLVKLVVILETNDSEKIKQRKLLRIIKAEVSTTDRKLSKQQTRLVDIYKRLQQY